MSQQRPASAVAEVATEVATKGAIPKPVHWIASSKKDLLDFPSPVKQNVGHALFFVQQGETPDNAKSLTGIKGGGGVSVMELVENQDGDTYRAVYTVKFKQAIYVLHCFQKKAKRGIKTDKQDLDLIRQRLKDAETDYKSRYPNG